MKYHALFVIFEKSSTILNRPLQQIIGGASWTNSLLFLIMLALCIHQGPFIEIINKFESEMVATLEVIIPLISFHHEI